MFPDLPGLASLSNIHSFTGPIYLALLPYPIFIVLQVPFTVLMSFPMEIFHSTKMTGKSEFCCVLKHFNDKNDDFKHITNNIKLCMIDDHIKTRLKSQQKNLAFKK